jgi:hypothetical protein
MNLLLKQKTYVKKRKKIGKIALNCFKIAFDFECSNFVAWSNSIAPTVGTSTFFTCLKSKMCQAFSG